MRLAKLVARTATRRARHEQPQRVVQPRFSQGRHVCAAGRAGLRVNCGHEPGKHNDVEHVWEKK